MPPCRIWNILMFSPSLPCESSAVSVRGPLPIATMASADSFDLTKHVIVKVSPGKSFSLHPIPATSTGKRFWYSWDVTMVCLLILVSQPHMPPLRSSCRQMSTGHFFTLRPLQCMGRSKPPCHLLMLPGVTPVHKGLAPSGKIHLLKLCLLLFICIFKLFQ